MEDSLLVSGTPRSGSALLAESLAGADGRVLFEPFHARNILTLRTFRSVIRQ